MLRAGRGCALAAAAAAALACNQGLEPIPASGACPPRFRGVCGTVQIRGATPESTQTVFIVAFPEFPESPQDLFGFRPVPPPALSLNDTVATYQLPLSLGRYEWILAVWQKQGELNATTAPELLREAGHYRDPADTTQPGVVTVAGGVDHVDFVVDFDNMRTMAEWFPQP